MTSLPTRHFLEVDDLSVEELNDILERSERARSELGAPLGGRGVALVFEKPSNRTRNSSEMAVVDLGGHPVYIQGGEVGLDVRESAEDVARTLACYHSVLCARVFDHQVLVRMAAAMDQAGSGVPVINLLSDEAHPCQALADLLTLRSHFGADLSGRSLAYIGDANNVWRSLALAAAMVGMETRVASPAGYGPSEADVARVASAGGRLMVTGDPVEAVDGADAIYTDVWTSMGQEGEAEQRMRDFAGFCVDARLCARAGEGALVMHCLPAHRGEEITADVVDGSQSVVWEQAANRRHAMRGLLSWIGESVGAGRSGSAASPVGPVGGTGQGERR